jgi:signal transduction histidine kinase
MEKHAESDFVPGDYGHLLTVITVVVTYVASYIVYGPELGLLTWAVLVGLGLLSLVLAVRFGHSFFHPLTPLKTGIYFFLQAVLCFFIQYLGRGGFWLVLMPLASTAASVLSRRATAAYLALLVAIFVAPFVGQKPATIVQNAMIFSCALIFVWLFTEVSVRDRLARLELERLARELEEANMRLRESAAQAEELARSRERNRLAREIHDSLGHYLTVVNVQLEAARALVENRGWREQAPDLNAALEKAQTLTRSGLADVRRSVAALRADPMGEKPFLDAVQALIDDNQEAGLLVSLHWEGAVRPAAPQTELALYRILQEALTNVRKHARASRADVVLEYGGQTVRLEVRDNGVGFSDAEEGEEKFGLRGIRERAELLQGRMEIGTNPGGGVRLMVELPWRADGA